MRRTILAARRLDAHQQMQTAVAQLAAAANLPVPDLGRRPPVRELDWLQRDEELATFLGFLAAAGPANPAGSYTAAQILAVDGLTATSRKALEVFFGGDSG